MVGKFRILIAMWGDAMKVLGIGLWIVLMAFLVAGIVLQNFFALLIAAVLAGTFIGAGFAFWQFNRSR